MLLRLLTVVVYHAVTAVDLRRPSSRESNELQRPFPPYRPFFDNQVVPENVRVNLFVFRDQIRRVFFLVERSSVLLTASPCSAPVEWHIFRKPLPPEDTSTESNGFLLAPDDGSTTEPVAGGSFYGSEQMIFLRRDATPGLYILEFDSDQDDTSVTLYGTTDPDRFYPFPQLPLSPKIDVLKVRSGHVLFTWKPSPSEGLPGKEVQYCVAANRKANFRTVCAVEAALHGDVPGPPHQDSGFGFWWEKAARRRFALKAREILHSRHLQEDVRYECIGRRTWHTFNDLESGETYFIDVFTIDARTNVSLAYPGTSVVAVDPPTVRVRDNRLARVVLDQVDNYTGVVKYVLNAKAPTIWLFVQSCSGPGPVQVSVSLGRTRVLTAEVMDTRTLSIDTPLNGTYVVKISSPVARMRRVHLLLSKKRRRFPFPTLPSDSGVRVMESLTTCNSVTLAWKSAVDEKVRYCIFKQQVHSAYAGALAKPQDTCSETEPSKKSGRVTCRRYHRFSKHRFQNVIMQRIRKLQPGATYVFEVLVTKPRGNTLPYEKVWATTPPSCAQPYRG